MARSKLKLVMGLERIKKPLYATEPDFVQQVNAQMKALTEELESIFQQVEEVTPDIMVEALQPTFDKSQRYCPVDKGPLKASGYLEITGKGKNARVEMGYGKGGKPRYAVYVHEITSYHHAPPTRSKWLQAALQEDMSQFLGRLSTLYRRFMGFGESSG